MDQHILNWLMFGFGGVVSFLLHQIWNAVKDLQKEDRLMAEKLATIQILVAGDYVKKSEFDSVVVRLFEKLDNIEHAMGTKEDRKF